MSFTTAACFIRQSEIISVEVYCFSVFQLSIHHVQFERSTSWVETVRVETDLFAGAALEASIVAVK